MRKHVVKDGRLRDRQRYRCIDCKLKFQVKRYKTQTLNKNLWEKYVWGKQTILQLSKEYGHSAPWVRKQLGSYQPTVRNLKPCSIVLTIDAFFFERGNGILLFRSEKHKQNILWFEITYEYLSCYLSGIDQLKQLGWQIKAIVCDGRRGIKETLATLYPVQMCQFHQVAAINRYLTRKPKLPAAIELRQLALALTGLDEATFTNYLNNWHTKWQLFFKERTINHETNRWFYTHKRVRSAYRSLKQNTIYLFTYQKYPALGIPNTTNSLDGSISHLRDKLRVHRGLKDFRRKSFLDEILSK